MRHKILLYQICVIILQSDAFTHWIVTENGRIEPKLDTHFVMHRPYDLIALLDQEKRCNEMNALMKEMNEQHSLIDNNSRFFLDYYQEDCLHESQDIPTTIASNASDRVVYSLHEAQPHNQLDARCTRFSSLPFSMRTFEHLPSIHRRNESTYETCGDCFPDMHWDAVRATIVEELSRNASSWIHYNLAFIYWWKHANIREAIECARRALHYAPNEYYDIPLANLGNLLHLHPEKLSDAITLIKAAIHHAPHEAKYYLLLGKAYVKNSEIEKAGRSFEKYQRLEKTNQGSTENMETISCFLKTLLDLKDHNKYVSSVLLLNYSLNFAASSMLQGILLNLHDFHAKQQRWLSLQERILWEGAPNEHTMTEALEDQVMHLRNAQEYKTIGKNIEWLLENSKKGQSERKLSITPPAEHESKLQPIVVLAEKYPSLMKVVNKYFDAPSWPTNDQCVSWSLHLDERENLNLPIFMPLENKGFQITKLLSKDIDLDETEEHSLPWYPPQCEIGNYAAFERSLPEEMKSILEKNKALPSHQILNTHFLKYINNGNSNEAEIGQRIGTAMRQKTAPSWILALLANMYWRIRGNTKNAMQCLSIDVPEEYSDVRYIALASMMYQLDFLDNALTYATLASQQNLNEPSTNFLLALIYYKKQNPIKALFHLKKVLRIEADYYGGEAERLLKLWACRVKLGEYEFYQRPEEILGNVCADNPEGIVCSVNGDKCKTAAIQCFRNEQHLLSTQSVESQLVPDSLMSSLLQDFHLQIVYNEENKVYVQNTEQIENELGEDVHVSFNDDSMQEVHLNEHSRIYILTRNMCNNINKYQWLEFSTIWKIFTNRIGASVLVDIEDLIYSTQSGLQKIAPKCKKTASTSSQTWDRFTNLILHRSFRLAPERQVTEWLHHILESQDSHLSELADALGAALNTNNTSWMLASAAAFYWHSVGNLLESVTCIRRALHFVPPDMKDIPLLHLANLLLSIGLHRESLEVVEMAIKINPNFIMHYINAGYNYALLGDFEKAVVMYRSALALDANFEPAKNRLMAILCLMLFDELKTKCKIYILQRVGERKL